MTAGKRVPRQPSQANSQTTATVQCTYKSLFSAFFYKNTLFVTKPVQTMYTMLLSKTVRGRGTLTNTKPRTHK